MSVKEVNFFWMIGFYPANQFKKLSSVKVLIAWKKPPSKKPLCFWARKH